MKLLLSRRRRTNVNLKGHHSDNHAASHYYYSIHCPLTDSQQILTGAAETLCWECRLGGCQSQSSIVDPGFTDDGLKLNTRDVGDW